MVKAQNAQLAALVDEFGELDRQLVLLRPLAAKRDQVRKQLESYCQDVPADQPVELRGDIYIVAVGARDMRRSITDMPQLFALLGEEDFLANCTFPLMKLDEFKIDTSKFLTSERTGPRSLLPILREPAERTPKRRPAGKTRGTGSADARGEARA